MKTLFVSTLVCSLAATAALAGTPAPAPVDPQLPAPAPAVMDWSGFYAGGTVAYGGGDMEYRNPGASWVIEDETGFGAFAGYNWQRGSLVYGAELGVLQYDGFPGGFSSESFDMMIDLKGRVGFAAGRALVYGFVGYTMGGYDIPGSGSWDVDGMNYGVGVDVAVYERMFVGVEYMVRDLEADATMTPLQTQESDLDMVQLRVGWRF